MVLVKNYHEAVNRIWYVNKQKKFNMFEKIIGLTNYDLIADNEFWSKNSDLLKKIQKDMVIGFGNLI